MASRSPILSHGETGGVYYVAMVEDALLRFAWVGQDRIIPKSEINVGHNGPKTMIHKH